MIFFVLGNLTVWRNGNIFGKAYQLDKTESVTQLFPASARGTILLGQDSDDFSVPWGIRDTYRAFQGSITHFMLWEYALPLEDIRKAYARTPPVDRAIATWDQWKTRARGRTIRVRRFKSARHG